MRKVQKTIDINAHIEELKYEISVDNGNAIAQISFINLGYGDITAIKFNVCGYNSFGDNVPVNGKEKFFVIIQDIEIAKNKAATDLKIKLPNSEMKKLNLEECQICYADGSVVSYEGNNSIICELEEINDSEQMKALHKLYNKNAKFKPLDFEQGWICSCGRFNRHEKGVCSLCGWDKAAAEKMCSEENREKLVEEYHISEENDRKSEELQRKKIKKERIKRNIIIGISAIVVIAACFFINHSITMSKRSTYSSAKEMNEALEGTYTVYSEFDGKARQQLIIKNGKYKYVYKSVEDIYEYSDIIFYPSQGIIHTFEDLIVTKDGKLESGKHIYEKGGYMSTDNDTFSSYTSSDESAYSVLKFTDVSVTSDSSYTICTGKVKNNGEKTYKFVTIKGSFKDSSGNVLDTDSTYAVGSEGLAPGESTSFRMSVDKDYNIKDCSISITDYDN